MSIIYNGQLDYLKTDNTISFSKGIGNIIDSNQLLSLVRNVENGNLKNIPLSIRQLVDPIISEFSLYARTGNIQAFRHGIIPITSELQLKVYPASDRKVVFVNFNDIRKFTLYDIYQIILYARAERSLHDINKINVSAQEGIGLFFGNLVNSIFSKKFGYAENKEALQFVLLQFHQYVLRKFFNENGLYIKLIKYNRNLEIDHDKLREVCYYIETHKPNLQTVFAQLQQQDIQFIDINQVIIQLVAMDNLELIQQFSSLDRFISYMTTLTMQKYNTISKSIVRYLNYPDTAKVVKWAINFIQD